MLVERYLLEEQIASGGMTSLWRARDQVLARHVAVKILHQHLALDEGFRERFLKEALAAAHLSHPGIAQIYDTGSDDSDGAEQHFIVLEYCDGGSVENLTEDEAPLAPGRVTAIAAVVCDALSYAHSNGVVHGDLRPANILLTADGGVKVTDFGIARAALASRDVSTTGTILGSVRYLSPEQVDGREVDERSDLYSLGVVVYELLVGRPPFADAPDIASALENLRQTPPPLRSIRGGIPRALDAAVIKALSRDPNDRFSSAQEMQDALSRAALPEAAASTQVIRVPRRTSEAERADTPVVHSATATEVRRILPVLALIAVAVLVAFLLPRFLDEDNRSPASTVTTQGGSGSAGAPIAVQEVLDLDPYGDDGEEHREEVGSAIDGDPGTAWTTENYNDPLEAMGKPGVGLRFDLGSPQQVSRVEISFGTPDVTFELRVGDTDSTEESTFEVVETIEGA
ncbi:MAG: eukaryotic-like serine/threonine-protein kinase, partial [Actinomycetota bacterium]|nr:eukaryotic-like serine/threonine-protein kinase [Actinomycetota bacterium]